MREYLLELESMKDQKQAIYLDLEYAFNLCKQSISALKANQGKMLQSKSKDKEKIFNAAQIIIYGILGLYEKAVEFSL